MKYLLVLLTLLMVGCAASPSQKGLDQMNRGNNQEAFNTFMACAKQGDSYCMNNVGYMIANNLIHMEEGHDREQAAITWFTLAARYGQPNARQTLAMMGLPLPPTDLYVAPQAPVDNSAVWAGAIGDLGDSASDYYDSQSAARAASAAARAQAERDRQANRAAQQAAQAADKRNQELIRAIKY